MSWWQGFEAQSEMNVQPGLKIGAQEQNSRLKLVRNYLKSGEKICSVIICFYSFKVHYNYTEATVDCASSGVQKCSDSIFYLLIRIIYSCNPHTLITQWWKQCCLIYLLTTSYITFTALVSVTFQTIWQKMILGDLLSVSPETTLSVYSTFPRMNGWGTCGWLQAQHMALGRSIVWAVWIVARVSWEDTGACVRAKGVPSKSVTF